MATQINYYLGGVKSTPPEFITLEPTDGRKINPEDSSVIDFVNSYDLMRQELSKDNPNEDMIRGLQDDLELICLTEGLKYRKHENFNEYWIICAKKVDGVLNIMRSGLRLN